MIAEHSSRAPELCYRWWRGWGSGSADWSYFAESAGSVQDYSATSLFCYTSSKAEWRQNISKFNSVYKKHVL